MHCRWVGSAKLYARATHTLEKHTVFFYSSTAKLRDKRRNRSIQEGEGAYHASCRTYSSTCSRRRKEKHFNSNLPTAECVWLEIRATTPYCEPHQPMGPPTTMFSPAFGVPTRVCNSGKMTDTVDRLARTGQPRIINPTLGRTRALCARTFNHHPPPTLGSNE